MLDQTMDASMEQTKTHKGLAVGVAATKLKLQRQTGVSKGSLLITVKKIRVLRADESPKETREVMKLSQI